MTDNTPSGIVLVDKPEGMTSFSVTSRIRKIFGVKKAGHAGTLDPFATGLLAVAVGRGTRVLRYMENDEKTYRAEMVLGKITSTGDIEGEVVGGKIPDETEKQALLSDDAGKIRESVKKMIGEITQVPSVYSAIKINGRPAYDYARKGQSVEIPQRKVTIFSIEIKDIFDKEELIHVLMDVHCSKGTYIRTLCEDIGNDLGTGAYCESLRRLSSGAFSVEQALPLEEIERRYSSGDSAFVVEEAEAMSGLPKISVTEKEAIDLRNGKKLDFSVFKDRMYAIGATEGERVLALHEDRPCAVIYSEQSDEGLLIREERVFA
ncbi:MAG: tRNA pseudouridine(55) synthase TruB [Saccharofermentanaceae bacterium]|nr:tRNA pseudouridine(55) synthase TruB [Saccharofermentanaceae bacterium]